MSMKASAYRSSAASSVTVTPDGGVNLGDRASSIADNQASDIMNMWFRDGALRLRPGIRKKLEQQYGGIVDVYPKDGRSFLIKRLMVNGTVTQEKYGVYIIMRKAVLAFDGQSLERIPSGATCDGDNWTQDYTDYDFDTCILIPGSSVRYEDKDTAGTTFRLEGGSLYIFGSGYYLKIMPEMIEYPFPLGELHIYPCVTVYDRDAYVPCIRRSAIPDGTGEDYEARNFLTPAVLETFTPDSASTVYKLCDRNIDNSRVTISYLDPANGAQYSAMIDKGMTTATLNGANVTLDRTAGSLTFSAAPKGVSWYKNNLSVQYEKTIYGEIPMAKCRFGHWYGDFDSRSGGGSRIFLAGDGSNIVYYSAADKPGYFPTDCVVMVGDGDDMVTGFGAQFGVLVVFKKHSVYALDTSTGSSFILRQVHIGDGCDMPGSIQSAGNFLIFANTVSGVFMLRSTQIKDERAVVHISHHVDVSLLALPRATLTSACSISTGGYYFLFAGTAVYCIDCSESRLIGSDAVDRIAFYIWQIPVTPAVTFLLESTVFVVSAADDAFYVFENDAVSDDGKWFEARWHSKEFGSGDHDRLLKLRPVILELCNTQAVDVLAGFTENKTPETVKLAASAVGEQHTRLLVGTQEGIADTVAVSVARASGSLVAYGIENVTFRLEKAAAAGTFVR